jgi:prevent-host-death family protein
LKAWFDCENPKRTVAERSDPEQVSSLATSLEIGEPSRIRYCVVGGIISFFARACYDVLQMLRWFMNRVITQRELRNESAAVLREVEAGRTFVLTRNGTPVAELRPIQPHRFVPRAKIADAVGRAPRVDARQFRADLDAVIDQRIDD